MLQMGDTVGPRYTAPKISAISYLFKTSLLNGRHRTTALYRFSRSIGPRYNGTAVYHYKALMQIKFHQTSLHIA